MEETFRAEMLNGSQVGATRGERKNEITIKNIIIIVVVGILKIIIVMIIIISMPKV